MPTAKHNVHLESGDLINAQQRAEEALKLSQRDHEKWDEGLIWILLGRIYAKAGTSQFDRGEACILKGIKILDQMKLKPLYAPEYHYLGELYADTGQQDKALGSSGHAGVDATAGRHRRAGSVRGVAFFDLNQRTSRIGVILNILHRCNF